MPRLRLRKPADADMGWRLPVTRPDEGWRSPLADADDGYRFPRPVQATDVP